MKNVLFLCKGNSCRSQMAEGWSKKLWPNIGAYSAGSAPSNEVDCLAVQVMAEKAISISMNKPKSISQLPKIEFDLVITLCGGAQEICPVFLGNAKVIHQGFEDPPALVQNIQSEKEALVQYRYIRDEIGKFISQFPKLFPELFS